MKNFYGVTFQLSLKDGSKQTAWEGVRDQTVLCTTFSVTGDCAESPSVPPFGVQEAEELQPGFSPELFVTV